MAAEARPLTRRKRLLLCTLLLAVAAFGIDGSAAFAADRTRQEAKTALDRFKSLGGVVPPPQSADGG